MDDKIIREQQVTNFLVELLGNKQKVLAIKVYRDIFGVGLKEAKDQIDLLESTGSISFPGINLHLQYKNKQELDDYLQSLIRPYQKQDVDSNNSSSPKRNAAIFITIGIIIILIYLFKFLYN